MKIIFGLLLTLAAIPLLFWNEGRAVRTAKSLGEGRGAVVSAATEKVDPTNEGKLVYVAGRAKTTDTVTDPVFGVAARAPALKRKVEMYQWKETVESNGRGADSRAYKYSREWLEALQDSSKFREIEAHRNPDRMPYKSEKWMAKVTLGAYTLTSAQVDHMTGEYAIKAAVPASSVAAVRALREREGLLYASANPDQPEVGDLRVTFVQVPEGDVSIVAQQVGSSFAPYHAKAGSTVDLERSGIVSVREMFDTAEESNEAATWALRVIGFVLIAIGLRLMLSMFSIGMPVIGRIISAGATLAAIGMAAGLSLLTIGVAWLVYRPLVGIVLLLLAAGAGYLLQRRAHRVTGGSAAAAPRSA